MKNLKSHHLGTKIPYILSGLIIAILFVFFFASVFFGIVINASVYLLLIVIILINMYLRIRNGKKIILLTEKVQAASKAKSDFLANMSHEIRTPMNAIMGLSDLMPTENLNEVQKNYLKDIRSMSRSLLGIINSILDFSKIEAGKMEFVPVHFNLSEMYNELVSMCGFIAAGIGLEFQTNKSGELPEFLFGDEIRIRQIYTNVINNALKYTRQGFVDFKLFKETDDEGKDFIVARVEDSGIGIKEEDMETLFGTFQRLNTNKNRRISGTGLGLAITKQLVELLKGTIHVESEYKKGSVFTIRIPLVPGDGEKVEQDSDISNFAVARENADIKILVADDAPVNLTVAKGYFSAHKMDIETCESGIQAVDKVKNNIYDMVFLDHMMPDMDGTEACKNIRSLEGEYFKKLPVIALSANAVSGARELFLESGMNDFISKPIDAYQLNRVLAAYLPPEKIVVGAVSSLLSEKNSYEQRIRNETIWNEEERNIFRELSAIEGLDTQKGVACVGNNAKEYFTMLKQFLAGVDANSEKFKSELKNENWKDYAILVHAYKGVLAIIGMNGLSEKAAFLETASKTILDGGAPAAETEKAAKLCKDYTDSFLDDVHNFREELLKTRLGKVEVIEKTKIDADTLKEKLNALEISCAAFKAKDVELISEELKKVSFDEKTDAELEAINKLTAAFRFADAAEKIKTLRTRLDL